MANTFDTSRVGGGTYELEQDSNGNYKLKSVGFEQVNKLNLPDVKDLNLPKTTFKPTTDTTDTTTTADPFLKLGNQQQGGGEGGAQDYSAIAPKEAKVKEATVKDFSDRQRLDPRDDRSPQEIQNLQTAQQDYKDASTAYRSDMGSLADKAKMDAANETIMSAQEKYRTETQYNPMPQTTGLQKVTSSVSNTVKNIMDNSLTVKVAKGVGSVFKGISNTITSPEQRANNSANTTALRNNGYQTDFQGKVVGRDGKAVSAADSVFGGMNSRSAFGDISKGAQSRIDTRTSTKTQERMSTKTKEKQDAFNQKTRDMQRELANHNNAKNTEKEKSKSQKSTNPNTRSGADNGNGGGRVICTDLHRTGELSTRDWIRDTKFTFTTLSKKHVKGYLLWAEPTVKHMQKYPRYRKIWKHIAQHRANDIAWRLNEGKFDLLGRIYAGIGEPVCWALGNFVSDKQISKYNLTHWRRA
ncbi:hypothetical protein N9349_05370 [Candidatus Pelagibacter sp.]|nr:hypothetical protein [Candidatus Pelagibacter sp.]